MGHTFLTAISGSKVLSAEPIMLPKAFKTRTGCIKRRLALIKRDRVRPDLQGRQSLWGGVVYLDMQDPSQYGLSAHSTTHSA